MKHIRRLRAVGLVAITLAALSCVGIFPASLMQAEDSIAIGKIHGHVINPTGAPEVSGTISLSTDHGHTLLYTFPVLAHGDYAGEASPGIYSIVFRKPDTPSNMMSDIIEDIEIVAGQDLQVDDDMSRREFIDKLPIELQRQLEVLKQKNAVSIKNNEIIHVLNADLRNCTQYMKDGDTATDAQTKATNYGQAEALMLKDTQIKPDASVLWLKLGLAQVGLMKYRVAESSLTKALEVENAAKRPNQETQRLVSSTLEQIRSMSDPSGTHEEPSARNQPVQQSAPPVPAPRHYADFAPPPLPPAPAPTVSSGMTKAQVIEAFGEPQRKAAAGVKEFFFYTDLKMKVTFTNGKVSSIE